MSIQSYVGRGAHRFDAPHLRLSTRIGAASGPETSTFREQLAVLSHQQNPQGTPTAQKHRPRQGVKNSNEQDGDRECRGQAGALPPYCLEKVLPNLCHKLSGNEEGAHQTTLPKRWPPNRSRSARMVCSTTAASPNCFRAAALHVTSLPPVDVLAGRPRSQAHGPSPRSLSAEIGRAHV